MNETELTKYFNWSCNMLVGNDPITTDNYLLENLDSIKKTASELLLYINYKPETIYRGIIMEHDGLNELIPHKGFTYISFSEDINIAKIFSDPQHELAFMVRERLGQNLFGYIIEYKPDIKEVLFHYRLIDILPYVEVMSYKGVDGSKLHLQKEITILQPTNNLKLKQNENEIKTK